MVDLKCVVGNCFYNRDCCCTKGEITVGNEEGKAACCESFTREEDRPVFRDSVSACGQQVKVDCETESCVYNRDCRCEAGHMDMGGNGQAYCCKDTGCKTFRETY